MANSCYEEQNDNIIRHWRHGTVLFVYGIIQTLQPAEFGRVYAAYGESLLSRLTPRQRQVLLTAYALGYYNVPRRISSAELSRHLKVYMSTVMEHLRKA